MAVTTKDLLAQERASMAVAKGEPHPADDDYVPPVSSVKLPSRGIVYPPESPLYMAESVDVKGMSAKEEDILSTPALLKKGTVLSTLMRACITNRLIDPDSMLPGDRNAVLIAIRVGAYGHEYNATATCPSCDEATEHVFDLSKLPMKTLDKAPDGGPGTNVFTFKTPSGKTVRFKLLSGSDVNKLERDAENARRAKGVNGGPEQGVTMRLLAQIISIEGIESSKLPKTILNMPARDSRALRKYMDDTAPGIDMEQKFECPSCGRESEVDVPLGTEFFWPSGE